VVRIVTQLLMGLMLLFATVTLTPKLMVKTREKKLLYALYYLMLWCVSLVFALTAFYYAYREFSDLF
jgi:hypothetical protein